MQQSKSSGGVLAACLKVVNRIALLAALALLGWLAWRLFGGDTGVPLGQRLMGEFWALFALVPVLVVVLFTFIARGLLTGTLKPAGASSDFDSSPGTLGSGSSFGSMGD